MDYGIDIIPIWTYNIIIIIRCQLESKEETDMQNERVRMAAKEAGIPLWKIAVRLNISEPTMTRWLRSPLTPERERKIMEAIKTISREES